MILSPIHCPTLVGRRKQLDFLRERASACANHHGSIVLVGGEAGSGKTRLVAEFCAQLPEIGLRHAIGSCLEYARQPLAPIISVIRAFLQSEPSLTPASVAERIALSRLMPEFDSDPAAHMAASDKLQQFEALAAVLKRSSTANPTVIVFEDLHWADAATNEFLQYIAREVGTTSLSILATYRSDELTPSHPLRAVIARLEREPATWHLELEPLTDEEMQRFITESTASHHSISADVALAIGRRAEGNPLLAEELLRSALAGEKRARVLPSSLREAVAQRLAQFNDSERRLVTSAAAIGRKFTADLVGRITGSPIDDVSLALKRAIDTQLVVEQEAEGVMEFRHALTREAVYAELLSTQARTLHARIAAAIEATPETGQQVAELAYQWWAAGNWSKAAEYNERAGDEAEAVYASQDAAIYFERALEATADNDPQRKHLSRKLAWSLYRSGMGPRAEDAFQQAIAAFIRASDTEGASQTLIDLAHLRWTLADMPGHEEAARRAMELVGDRSDRPVWYAARVQMAWAHALSGFESEKAMAWLTEAERSTAAVRAWDRVKFHECKALIHILQGDASVALTEAQNAATIAHSTRDIANAVRCWGNVGLVAAQSGQRELSDTAFNKAMGLIEAERPVGWPVPWAYALRAHAQYLYGDLIGASKSIQRALFAILDVPSLDVLLAWVAIPLGLAVEDHALVTRCFDEQLIDFAFRSGSGLVSAIALAFAQYYRSIDRSNAARALLERAVMLLPTRTGNCEPMLAMVAEECEEPHLSRARSFLVQISESSKTKSAPAYLTLFDARVEKRFGDKQKSIATANKAATMFGQLQWPLYEAQSLEVAERQRDALYLYRKIGATGEIRRLQAMSPQNKRGRRKDELTGREKEIACLILENKSNKDIAARLVLSERTVESHVSSIFNKLDVTSRQQLSERLKASKTVIAKDR